MTGPKIPDSVRQLKKQSPRAIIDENNIINKGMLTAEVFPVSSFKRIISDFSKHKSINFGNNEWQIFFFTSLFSLI